VNGERKVLTISSHHSPRIARHRRCFPNENRNSKQVSLRPRRRSRAQLSKFQKISNTQNASKTVAMRPRDRYAPSPRVKFSAHTNSSSRSVVFSSPFLPRVVSRVVGFAFFVVVSRTPSPSRLARFLVALPRSAPPSFVDASPPRLVRSIRALLLPPFPRVARVAIARRGGIPSVLSSPRTMPLDARRFQMSNTLKTKRATARAFALR